MTVKELLDTLPQNEEEAKEFGHEEWFNNLPEDKKQVILKAGEQLGEILQGMLTKITPALKKLQEIGPKLEPAIKRWEENREVIDEISEMGYENLLKLLNLSEEEINELSFWEIIDLVKALEKEFKYHTIGNSVLTTEIKSLFGYAGTGRNPRNTKDKEITTTTDLYGNQTITIRTKYTDTTSLQLSIENYSNIFAKQDRNTRKILNFILMKSNKQNDPEVITFKISELVDIGMFSNIGSAKRGLDIAMDKLTKIRVLGAIKKGNVTINNRISIMFSDYERDKQGRAFVIRNKYLDMKIVTAFITLFPKWAYPLSAKAYAIIDYLSIQARRNISKIKKEEKFNIGLRALSDHLGQPEPTETKNPSRDIKEAILNAIDEIEDAQRAEGIGEILITPRYKESNDIYEFLDGYLEIELQGEYLSYFTELGAKKEKEITKAKKKKIGQK